VSQTPTEAEGPAEDYKLGWIAINKLVKQGFSWSGHERNCVFLNTRGGPFASVSTVAGLDFEDDGRSMAPVDWDFDGDLDLLVANRTGPRLRFLRNGLNGSGGFLQLKLIGRSGNRDAIGARVEILLNDPLAAPLMQTRRAGGGYLAQASAWLHFGLGADSVQGVKVLWPNGKTENFTGAQADGRYLLEQGRGQAQAWTSPVKPQNLVPSVPLPPRPRSSARVVLTSPVPMPKIELESADGRRGSLFGVEARARTQVRSQQAFLVQIWASWCAPCAEELADFTAAAEQIQAAGLKVLALNIEPESEREPAREMLERIGWPYRSGFASANTVDILDTLQGTILGQDIRIPVPSSFLIDAGGNLVAFYLGRVDSAQVLQDLQLVPLNTAERLAAAMPFPGHWYSEPSAQSPMFLEAAFRERSLPATAQEYQPGWIHIQYGRAFTAQRRLVRAEEQFRLALTKGPYFAEAYAGLGYTLHMQGKTVDAIEPFRRSVELDPKNAVTIFSLGLTYLALKDTAAVQAQIKRLGTLDSRYAAELTSRLEKLEDH
jgi:tetratricopeptide (TPR) repeat protein